MDSLPPIASNKIITHKHTIPSIYVSHSVTELKKLGKTFETDDV